MELNGRPPTPEELAALGLTGYGHFTTMLVTGGRVRGLGLHLERLVRDCRQLFCSELDPDEVRRLVRRVTADRAPTVVRVTVYDPGLGPGDIGRAADPRILVTHRPAPQGTPGPLALRTARYSRESPEIKHVSLFGALQLRRRCRQDGYDDVVFLDPDGAVSEIATSNIGFVRGDEVVWPRANWLSGVTMNLIDRILGTPVVTEPVTVADLGRFDAVFATNAAVGVRPVRSVDGLSWPTDHPGPARLSALYRDVAGDPL